MPFVLCLREKGPRCGVRVGFTSALSEPSVSAVLQTGVPLPTPYHTPHPLPQTSPPPDNHTPHPLPQTSPPPDNHTPHPLPQASTTPAPVRDSSGEAHPPAPLGPTPHNISGSSSHPGQSLLRFTLSDSYCSPVTEAQLFLHLR
ncbi:hypothetical protein JZ751_008938 [Albula glossodonta]|uniref:Uncharacterized protein n=1 Tax=Albula glossodonta TaxID=121402 RepID=A0A8T2NXL9_9TELE|nr:hypothetical protein JZ751_008938 [Albula glossodonta]